MEMFCLRDLTAYFLPTFLNQHFLMPFLLNLKQMCVVSVLHILPQHSLLFATTKQWLQYPKRSYSTILSQVILFPPTETTCGLPDGFDNDFTRYYWRGKKPFNRELEAISSLLLKTIAITTSLFSFTRASCKRNIKESRSGNWMLSLSTVDACMDPVYARMLKSLTGCLIELSASHFY